MYNLLKNIHSRIPKVFKAVIIIKKYIGKCNNENNKIYILFNLYASLTCLSFKNNSLNFKSYIFWKITNNVDVIGIKKINPFWN